MRGAGRRDVEGETEAPEVTAQDQARAFIAGMEHVMHCNGCPICLAEPPVPSETVPEKAKEQTLEESVKRNPE